MFIINVFSVTKTRQWQAKSGSVIIKTMIKCIFCFQWWERTGLKCYVWAQMQDIFPPIVHLVCLLKCNVSLFPILNRDLCRSLSCAWGRLGSHCLSITLTHTHMPAEIDTLLRVAKTETARHSKVLLYLKTGMQSWCSAFSKRRLLVKHLTSPPGYFFFGLHSVLILINSLISKLWSPDCAFQSLLQNNASMRTEKKTYRQKMFWHIDIHIKQGT